MRIGFRTNLEETLLRKLKIIAIQLGVDVNDILEPLIEMYVNGEVEIEIKKSK